MKIQFPKIKKHFKKDSSEIKPDLYWKIILNSAIALIILFFVFGYYNLSRINKESILSIEETNLKSPNVQIGRIENILKHFESRQMNSAEIITAPSLVVDPSI